MGHSRRQRQIDTSRTPHPAGDHKGPPHRTQPPSPLRNIEPSLSKAFTAWVISTSQPPLRNIEPVSVYFLLIAFTTFLLTHGDEFDWADGL